MQTASPEPRMTHHLPSDRWLVGVVARLSSWALLLAMGLTNSEAALAAPAASSQHREGASAAESAHTRVSLIDAYYYFVHWVSMGRLDKAVEQFDPAARVIAGTQCTADAPCVGRAAIRQRYLPALLAGELPLPLADLRFDGITVRTYGDANRRSVPSSSAPAVGDHEIALGRNGIVSLRFGGAKQGELYAASSAGELGPIAVRAGKIVGQHFDEMGREEEADGVPKATAAADRGVHLPSTTPTRSSTSVDMVVLVHRITIPTDSSWGVTSMALSVGHWRVGDADGAVATAAELTAALQDVVSIEIGGVCRSWLDGPTLYPCGFSVRNVDLAGLVNDKYTAMEFDDGFGPMSSSNLTMPATPSTPSGTAATPAVPRFVAVQLPHEYLRKANAALGGHLRFEVRAISNPLVPSQFDSTSGVVILRARKIQPDA